MTAAFDRQRPQPTSIEAYGPGWFQAGGTRHAGLLLAGAGGVSAIPPRPLAELTVADLAPLLTADPAPELLLIGTGTAMTRPPAALLAAVGVAVEFMDTRAAMRTYNVLLLEERRVAAVLWPLA